MLMGMVPLFFDLDHTLWDFVSNSRKTLREGYEAFALRDVGVTDFSEWVRVFERTNDWCWEEYRQGRMNKTTLRSARFEMALQTIGSTAPSELAKELDIHYIQYSPQQTGLIDGVITGHSVLKDFKLDEVADAITLGAPLGRVSFYTVMNQEVYEDLPADQKAALDAASGAALSKSAEDAWLVTANAALETAKGDSNNTIVELSATEAAVFADALQGVVDAYVDSVDGAATLMAMRK